MTRIGHVHGITAQARKHGISYDDALAVIFVTYVLLADGDRFDLEAFTSFDDASLAIGDASEYAKSIHASSEIVAVGIRF